AGAGWQARRSITQFHSPTVPCVRAAWSHARRITKGVGEKGAKGGMVETKRIVARARPLTAPAWLRIGILAVALIAILIAVAIRVSAPTDATTRALVGKPAPDFTLPVTTAPGVTPQTVSLGAQRSHPVVLVFFFTLCTHCQQQLRTV